jgi:hypothetical protein
MRDFIRCERCNDLVLAIDYQIKHLLVCGQSQTMPNNGKRDDPKDWALESSKDAGLTPGTTLSDAFISGFEACQDSLLASEAQAHIQNVGRLQSALTACQAELAEAKKEIEELRQSASTIISYDTTRRAELAREDAEAMIAKLETAMRMFVVSKVARQALAALAEYRKGSE